MLIFAVGSADQGDTYSYDNSIAIGTMYGGIYKLYYVNNQPLDYDIDFTVGFALSPENLRFYYSTDTDVLLCTGPGDDFEVFKIENFGDITKGEINIATRFNLYTPGQSEVVSTVRYAYLPDGALIAATIVGAGTALLRNDNMSGLLPGGGGYIKDFYETDQYALLFTGFEVYKTTEGIVYDLFIDDCYAFAAKPDRSLFIKKYISLEYSVDEGGSWTPVPGYDALSIRRAKWVHDRFFLITNNNRLYYSSDGATWTDAGTVLGATVAIYDVAYDAIEKWCVVGALGKVAISADLAAWAVSTRFDGHAIPAVISIDVPPITGTVSRILNSDAAAGSGLHVLPITGAGNSTHSGDSIYSVGLHVPPNLAAALAHAGNDVPLIHGSAVRTNDAIARPANQGDSLLAVGEFINPWTGTFEARVREEWVGGDPVAACRVAILDYNTLEPIAIADTNGSGNVTFNAIPAPPTKFVVVSIPTPDSTETLVVRGDCISGVMADGTTQ